MLKTVIVLPDGTELSSGSGTINAIQSVTITECVNEQQELTMGSCCSNMLEAKLITPEGAIAIAAGDELTVYKENEDGRQIKIGLFTAEKPTRPSANSMSITAYDRICWLDKDLTQWLASFNVWPCTLYQLADTVCAACGLELLNESIPNGDYLVQRFSADGITGRQLMRWIGEISGRFIRATPDGYVELAWYEPMEYCSVGPSSFSSGQFAENEAGDLVVNLVEAEVTGDAEGAVEIASDYVNASDDEEGNLIVNLKQTLFYYQNGLSFEDYQVAAIQKVQLRQNDEDVGTIYPEISETVNTYIITGNLLLTANTAEDLLPVARTLYEQLKTVTYTPCNVSLPVNLDISAGHILQIQDKNGRSINVFVMTKTTTGQRITLECTGSATRSSSSAVNNQNFKALNGKVLNLRTDVDGLKAENKDAAGRVAKIEMDLEGIRTQMNSQTGVEERMTTLEQTARDLTVRVTKIDHGEGEGAKSVKTTTGFTLDENGLRIAKEKGQMENLLDNNGMCVMRGSEKVLRADKDGVNAIDITVRNYLVVGLHARFEDYNDGSGTPQTACFWI